MLSSLEGQIGQCEKLGDSEETELSFGELEPVFPCWIFKNMGNDLNRVQISFVCTLKKLKPGMNLVSFRVDKILEIAEQDRRNFISYNCEEWKIVKILESRNILIFAEIQTK